MPVKTNIAVFHVDRYVSNIQAIERFVVEEARTAIAGLLRSIARRMAIYPAKRPQQRYVRTGELGRGWKTAEPRFVIQQGSIDARISNPVPYVRYVQGDEQVLVHKGRWTPAREVLREFADDIRRGIDDAVGRAAQRAQRGG